MSNADNFKGLAEDMVSAYKDRVKAIKDVKSDTKKLLNTCKEEDKKRVVDVSKLKADADKLVKDLGGDNKKLKAEVGKFLGDCAKDGKTRAADMGKFLGDCKKEDKARASDVSKLKADADKLVKHIGGDNKKLKADTRALVNNLTGESKKRVAEVADLLGDYKKERVATATAWKGLLSTMSSTRGAKPSPIVKAAAKVEAKALVVAGKKKPAKSKGKKRTSKKK